jgi:hypothetical protein
MQKPPVTPLPIAVRVYPDASDTGQDKHVGRKFRLPDRWIIFDTETRVDATQRLTFGSYRVIVKGGCVEEGLLYGDDLPQADIDVLKHYVSTHSADTVPNGNPELRLFTRDEFLDLFFAATYKGRFLAIAFNFPFDISRIACEFTTGRGRFAGGFSLGLWSYIDKQGKVRRHQYRPRVGIKHIDSKRALKGYTARNEPDREDLIPEGSPNGAPEDGYIFRGNFLDLRTLAFALTDKGHSLESACQAFGVEHGKSSVARHGEVTEAYIDYNRRDVLATVELAQKLVEEFDKHPIDLQITKAYSPASIGKSYLRKMGIVPVLERQPSFPKKYLGYAQSAFFGGRTSTHIRKVPIPVVYSDFVSMYPTVNSNMGLWRFVIAKEIRVIEHYEDKLRRFLNQIALENLFDPRTWKHLTGFAKVIPNGDILPNRGKYSQASNDWQVAVNHLYPNPHDPASGLWFSIPDIVASVILTGRVPNILEAFRIEPVGIAKGLKPTKLRGVVVVDPAKEDFFKVVAFGKLVWPTSAV